MSLSHLLRLILWLQFIMILLCLWRHLHLILRMRVMQIVRSWLALWTLLVSYPSWSPNLFISAYCYYLLLYLKSLRLYTLLLHSAIIFKILFRQPLLLNPLPYISWKHLSIWQCPNYISIWVEITTRLRTVLPLNILQPLNPVPFQLIKLIS